MSDSLLDAPTKVAELEAEMEAMRRHYEAELAKRDVVVDEQGDTIVRLQAYINKLLAHRFGQSSEKVSDAQLGLFNEAELEAANDDEADDADAEPTGDSHADAKPRGKRSRLPSHLPRIEIIHDLADDEKVCPHDGTALEVIGSDDSERLRVIPARFEVIVDKRLKYACPCCRGHVHSAPLPVQPIPKSMATPELLAYVATGKYADAQPLYRQSKQFARVGVDVSRQTLARWMMQVGVLLIPLLNLLRDELLAQRYIQMDETTLQVLKEPGRAPETKSYLWVQRGMDPGRTVVLFSYRSSRASEVATELIGDFQGVIQTDRYSGYLEPASSPGLTHAHCMAHARRFFTDGLKALGLNPKRLPLKPPPEARRLIKGLGLIRGLYAIERRIKDCSPEERYQVRQQDSAEALERLQAWVRETRPKVTPDSDLGKGLRYIENAWDGLTYFMVDGHVEIDNNLCENEIRPFAVGRRAWLFADTPHGAHASAGIYSLVVTAKAHALNPYDYLTHVLRALPTATSAEDVEALLPWNAAETIRRDH